MRLRRAYLSAMVCIGSVVLQLVSIVVLFLYPDTELFIVNLPLFVFVAIFLVVNFLLFLYIKKDIRIGLSLGFLLWNLFLLFLPLWDISAMISVVSHKDIKVKTQIDQIPIVCSQNTAGVSPKYTGFWHLLEQQGCDIVLLQEVWPYLPDDLTLYPLLGQGVGTTEPVSYYPYSYRYREFMFLSKYPITAIRDSEYEGFSAVSVRLSDTKEIILVNVHIWTPLNDRRLQTFKSNTPFQRVAENGIVRASIVRKFQKAELISFLVELRSRGNVLIAGDFNTLPHNQFLRHIVDVGFVKVGGIWAGFTFPQRFPLLAIDHAFVSSSMAGKSSVDLVLHHYSDHTLVKLYAR